MIILVFYYTIINITVRPGLLTSGLFLFDESIVFWGMIEYLIHDSRESEMIPVTFVFDSRYFYFRCSYLV